MVENRGKTKLKPSPEFVSSLGENSRQLLDKIVAEVEVILFLNHFFIKYTKKNYLFKFHVRYWNG